MVKILPLASWAVILFHVAYTSKLVDDKSTNVLVSKVSYNSSDRLKFWWLYHPMKCIKSCL